MVTLRHDQVTSFVKFTKRLIDHFDGTDPELNIKDLAQLKQTSTVDNYIIEFQRLSVLVIDISERHQIVLFMDGLKEPLRGWIKGFNLCTLNEAIKKVRDMATFLQNSCSYTNTIPTRKQRQGANLEKTSV